MAFQVDCEDLQPVTHYHIQWSHRDHLDWERFDTGQAAEEAARRLVQPGEKFRIKAEGENCSRCAIIRAKYVSASGS